MFTADVPLKRVLLFILSVLLCAGVFPYVVKAQSGPGEDLSSLNLADILNLQITTASRTAESVAEAPAIISVITKKEIEQMGARSFLDVLNMVPGITTGAWVSSSSLYVRGAYSGGSSNTVLLLINGQRANEVLRGSALFTRDLPVHNVKQIEIIRGPGSALYGANAFVAVINIITESAFDIDGADVSYKGGTHDGHYASAKFGREINENIDVMFSGSFSNYENRDLPLADFRLYPDGAPFLPPPLNQTGIPFTDHRAVDTYQIYTSEGKMRLRDLTLNFGYTHAESKNSGGTGLARQLNDASFLTGGVENDYNFGLKYDVELAPRTRLHAMGSYSNNDVEFRAANANYTHVYQSTPEGLAAATIATSNSTSLQTESYVEWLPSSAHTLVGGLSFQRDATEGHIFQTHVFDQNGVTIGVTDRYFAYTNINPEARKIFAAFLQHTWKIYKFSITGGFRADKYDDFGLTVNPRVAAVINPNDAFTIKALYGQAFRSPSLFERSLTVPSYAIPPASPLEPEIIRTYEVQLGYKTFSSFAFSVNAFLYNIKDVIRFLTTPDPNDNPIQSQFVNRGTQHAKGIETEIRYRPTHSISVFANYSTATSTDRLNRIETDVFGVPRHNINGGVFIGEIAGKVDVNFTMNHRRDWVAQPAEVDQLGIKFLDSLQLPNYTLLNTRIIFHNLHPSLNNLKLTFDAFNLLGETMLFADPSLTSHPVGIARGGRQFLIGMRLEL